MYHNPSLEALKEYCKIEIDGLWDEVKRFENPHTYYVDMSKNLWQLKQDMLEKCRY